MNFYERAVELKDETIAHRRYLHTNAEVGLDTPLARAYVMEQLQSMGIDAKECGHGVTATLGNGNGKTILLRADMDALPMEELSGEPFACPSGKAAHTCGHDFHAAMLLTAAKMLKESEDQINGTIKFMFQPAEETFEGGRDMIANGILENPVPDVALAFHVGPGKMPVGLIMYNNTGTAMFSVDGFRIEIKGKGSHGAYPQAGIDPINIGVHIHLALQELIARESDPMNACVLTIGKFQSGAVGNIIPDTAEMEGTIRTNNADARALLVRRMKEVAAKVAEVYGGSAEVTILSDCPPLTCDPKFTTDCVSYIKELGYPGYMEYPGIVASASEDFALITERVPSSFIYLSAGYFDERGDYSAHNPRVQFNEDVCPIGAASYAQCALRWLADNQ